MTARYTIRAEIADKICMWIQQRGGAQVWSNEEIGGPDRQFITPVCGPDGTTNTAKPHWSCGAIQRVLTRLDEVQVEIPREVRRFRVGLRRGSGMRVELTDGATRRVRRMCADYRRWSCTCGWSGFARDLRTKKADTCSFSVCPTCRLGSFITEGLGAWHSFDYDTQEAVILVEDRVIPLEEYAQTIPPGPGGSPSTPKEGPDAQKTQA